jgi:hypothetical protein
LLGPGHALEIEVDDHDAVGGRSITISQALFEAPQDGGELVG